MKEMIQELYEGKISPQEEVFIPSEELKVTLQKLEKIEEQMVKNQPAEFEELFMEYMYYSSHVQMEQQRHFFNLGFELGCKLTRTVLSEGEGRL